MKNRDILHKQNNSYHAYHLIPSKNGRMPGVLFLINDTFYLCYFLGTGAIYIYRKYIKDSYVEVMRVHPHYEKASLIGMFTCAYTSCIDYDRKWNCLE